MTLNWATANTDEDTSCCKGPWSLHIRQRVSAQRDSTKGLPPPYSRAMVSVGTDSQLAHPCRLASLLSVQHVCQTCLVDVLLRPVTNSGAAMVHPRLADIGRSLWHQLRNRCPRTMCPDECNLAAKSRLRRQMHQFDVFLLLQRRLHDR